MFYHAPVAVFVFTHPSALTPVEDAGTAVENMFLYARSLGIGSCWIGWFDEKALKEELQISPKKKIDIVISLGYSAEDKVVPKTRKALAEISSFNKYA